MPSDTEVAISMAINDLAELKDRQATRSNQFKLPKTEAVLDALEGCDQVDSTTNLPYLKNTARLEMDGEQVIPKGFAIIENSDEFINVTIYSGIIDFFELIDKKKLNELDLSSYNHIPDITNIITANPFIDGYKYPIIDFGAFTNVDRNVLLENLRIAWFVHTLVDKIFEEAGFSKKGVFWESFVTNDPNYNKLLLPYTEDAPYWLVNITLNISYTSSLAPAAHTIKIIKEDSAGNRSVLGVSTFDVLGTAYIGHYDQVITNVKLYPGDLVYVESTGNGGLGTQGIIRGNATFPIFGYQPYSSIDIAFPSDPTKDISIGLSADYGPLLTSGTERIPFDDESAPFFDTGATYDNAAFENETPAVNAQAYTPNITQKDLIKTLANQFALFFARDPFTKTIYAARMNDIENNRPYAIHWTDKMHMGSDKNKPKLDYRLPKYAQKNYLKYKNDSSDKDIEKETGNGYFEVADENLPAQATLIELPFAATEMTKALIDLDVPIIRRIEDGEFKIKVEPRMLIDDTADITDLSGDIHYDDGGAGVDQNTDIPFCYFQLPAKDFSLGYDNTLLRDYYDGLTLVLTKVKKVTAYFNLTTSDIIELDAINPNTGLPNWFTPRYLHQYSSYFYVNKVDSFKGYGLTKVELVRLGGGDVCIPTYSSSLFEDPNFLQGSTYWNAFSNPANWTIDATGALHLPPGSSDRIENTTPATPYVVSPTGKCKAIIRVTGMTVGSFYIEVAGVAGITRYANGEYSEIIETGTATLDRLIPWVSDDFDGKIEYADAFAQLTCP